MRGRKKRRRKSKKGIGSPSLRRPLTLLSFFFATLNRQPDSFPLPKLTLESNPTPQTLIDVPLQQPLRTGP